MTTNTSDTTITITIPAGMFIGSKVAGEPLPVMLANAHPSFLLKFLAYGVQRVVNDRNGGETPENKLALAKAFVADINAGKAYVGRVSSGGAPGLSPVEKRAHDEAKAFLKGVWARRGLSNIAAFKADAKAKVFFKDGDSKAWDETAVTGFISDTKDHPQVPDFMTDAESFIAAQGDGDTLADLDI